MEVLLAQSNSRPQQYFNTSSSNDATANQTAPFALLNSRHMGVAHQFKTAMVTPAQIDAKKEADVLAVEEAFSLPSFVANRICPWCSKFCHEDHFAGCHKRLVICPICQEYVLADDAVQHYQTCQERVLCIATERVVHQVEERRRRDEEDAERRRVQMLHAQADADAAALRQRASSIVTRKQSIGNLLFSGVSMGNEGVEVQQQQQHQQQSRGGDEGAQQDLSHPLMTNEPRRSMVRILSEPEIARSSSQTSSQAFPYPLGDSAEQPYNRQSSFFTRTNSVVDNNNTNGALNDGPAMETPALLPRHSLSQQGSRASMTEHRPSTMQTLPTRNSIAVPESGGDSVVNQAPPPAAPAVFQSGGRGSATLQRAATTVTSNQLKSASSFSPAATFAPRRQTFAAGGYDGTSPSRGHESQSAAPPLPDALQRKRTPPDALPRRQSAPSIGAPPSVPPRKTLVVPPHIVPLAATPNPTYRAPSVESVARAPSVTSSSAIATGMKRCKWCGTNAPQDHERKCASRIVMCKKCSSMIKMKDKEEHVKICAEIRNDASPLQGGRVAGSP